MKIEGPVSTTKTWNSQINIKREREKEDAGEMEQLQGQPLPPTKEDKLWQVPPPDLTEESYSPLVIQKDSGKGILSNVLLRRSLQHEATPLVSL